MKRTIDAIALVSLVIAMACSKQPSTINADSYPPRSVPAPAVTATAQSEQPVTVPVGAKLRVVLLDGVSSDKSQPGDSFMASLAEPIVIDGKTIFAKGTKVRGRVIDATDSGRVKGRASLELRLTDIIPDEGESIGIATKSHTAVAESTKKRDVAIVGGGAGIGAAIGALTGGKKGAAIGAAVGGGAGAGSVLATKGKEIRFAPEHPLSFTLARSIEI